ncbi:MAG: hypothetical protein ABEH35_05275 [Haloarculaceae archaeon]
MDQSLDIGEVADELPDLADALDDPRLRPVGLVGGAVAVLIGVLFHLSPGGFWGSVVAGVLIFVGVPLFCLGLAAPEPEREDTPFRLGIDLSPQQRRIVAGGSLLLVLSPMLVAALGPYIGFTLPLWLASATLAVLGCVLILTGFIAWTSRELSESTSTPR